MLSEQFNHFIKNQKLTNKSLCWATLMQEALNRGLSVKALGSEEITGYGFKLNAGNRLGHFFTVSDGTKTILFNKSSARDVGLTPKALPKSKFAFKRICSQLKLNTADGILVTPKDTVQVLLNKADLLGYPLVLKPDQGSMGRKVFVDLKTPDDLLQAYAASGKNKTLLLEPFIEGTEYRVYMIGGRFITACKRTSAQVKGDGNSTIANLIKKMNAKKMKSGFDRFVVDEQTSLLLQQQGLTLDHVLAEGKSAVLSKKLGRSSGGSIVIAADDFSDRHRRQLASLAAQFSDNAVMGVDVLLKGNNLYIIELNFRPQLSSAMLPDSGETVDMPAKIINHFFPHSRRRTDSNLFDAATLLKTLKNNPLRSIWLENKGDNSEAMKNKLPIARTGVADLIPPPDYAAFFKLGNPNQAVLRKAAYEMGCDVLRWKNEQGFPRWSVQAADKLVVFRESMPSLTSVKTRTITNDKGLTKKWLAEAGVRVPAGLILKKTELSVLLHWFRGRAPGAVVVKPFNGTGGKGVTNAITSEPELIKAFNSIECETVIAEEHVNGTDHRLMVVGGRFVAAIKRHPAHVVGDGSNTVAQLVDKKNEARKQNPYIAKSLLKLAERELMHLAKAGLAPESIPAKGQHVQLTSIANIRAGGDSEDVTDKVHADFIALAEKVWRVFPELAFCGVDVLVNDISQPAAKQPYAVIEINANCDIALHHFPILGSARDVAAKVMSYLFGNAKVPVISVSAIISGKVQHVGFRNWLKLHAVQRGLSGHVKNVGKQVHVVLQGPEVAVNGLLGLCAQGPAKANVKDIKIERQLKADTPAGFVIL